MRNCLCVKLILQIIYDWDEIDEDDGDYLWGLELLVSGNALKHRDSCLIRKPFKNLHIIGLFMGTVKQEASSGQRYSLKRYPSKILLGAHGSDVVKLVEMEKETDATNSNHPSSYPCNS